MKTKKYFSNVDGAKPFIVLNGFCRFDFKEEKPTQRKTTLMNWQGSEELERIAKGKMLFMQITDAMYEDDVDIEKEYELDAWLEKADLKHDDI
jgi:hypothetical protein